MARTARPTSFNPVAAPICTWRAASLPRTDNPSRRATLSKPPTRLKSPSKRAKAPKCCCSTWHRPQMAKAHSRMPVVFFGHGSPMNTLERNKYTESWRALGESIPRPKAILCVSAHWYTEGTAVTAMREPKTIHDFYGFPQALFDVRYPAPGDPQLASRVRELLEPVEVRLDESWGLDHGTWSVLKHAYPGAEIPVVQLSIDGTQPPQFHYEVGKRLAPLRDEGVLVAGSGNVVHNLRLMKRAGGAPFDWAVRFNERIREALASRNHRVLVDF